MVYLWYGIFDLGTLWVVLHKNLSLTLCTLMVRIIPYFCQLWYGTIIRFYEFGSECVILNPLIVIIIITILQTRNEFTFIICNYIRDKQVLR